jgi:hypothetical protein
VMVSTRLSDFPTHDSFSRMTVPFVSDTFYAPGACDLMKRVHFCGVCFASAA